MITADLNVGDTAYANFTRYTRFDVRRGTVIGKSATGVLRVDFGTSAPYSFMANGRERGGDKYHAAQLITRESYDRLSHNAVQQQREHAASNAVKAAYELHATIANKTKLIDALRAALAAVEAM